MHISFLSTDNPKINFAYRLAIATLSANIYPFRDGLLTEEKPLIIAGMGYCTPWTRDAAINTWNAGGLLCPEVARDTLLSVLERKENGLRIAGEYWDAIIWAVGAWQYYLYTGDEAFLSMAYEAVCNSLAYFEETEFNPELGLFRGAACYGDGVAAYPDIYAQHGHCGIISFSRESRSLCHPVGVGVPMHALSTNCLYYRAYVLADEMAARLGLPARYAGKATALREAINREMWDEKAGTYRYLRDDFGNCEAQEGLGCSFAVLFGVADRRQAARLAETHVYTPHGTACVYPSFSRYDTPDGLGFGRHSGTVWPHVQGFWADAAAQIGDAAAFDREFLAQTENTVNSQQFAEIYHPLTGEMYGGRQEDGDKGIREWRSEPHQTWSATAYLRNVHMNLVGMTFELDGIRFAPVNTTLVKDIRLSNLPYRQAMLNIAITGSGERIVDFKVNGKQTAPFIPVDSTGVLHIEIVKG